MWNDTMDHCNNPNLIHTDIAVLPVQPGTLSEINFELKT